MPLPAPKSDFVGFEEHVVHLAAGGQPPMLEAHRGAFERFLVDKSRGTAGYQAHWAEGDETKARLAELTALPAADHALLGNASEGIARVLSSIAWEPGDNVVASAKDYASGRFSLLNLASIGVEPRLIEARGWYIEPQALIDACDARTRLVYLSQVTSLTGQRFDIAAIAEALSRRGVALLVDASHALGVIPVDGRLADFTVASCYKNLCATHMGILAWNREKQPRFEPLAVGWASAADGPDGRSYALYEDARRAELGNPNHLDVYLLNASLAYLLGHGIEPIAAHVRALADRLHRGLRALGLEVVTPAAPAERASNVAFAHPDNAAIVRAAATAGIYLWDGDGRVRASVHVYNGEADIERYLGWLASERVAR